MKATLCAAILTGLSATASSAEPVEIGSRRELFVDDALIERLSGQTALWLHHPQRR